MAAANHGERISGRKIRCAGKLRDGFFAGVDEVGIDFGIERIGTDAKHAVFTLQNHLNPGRNIVGHQRRHADPQVHIEAVLHLARDAFHNALALFYVFCFSRFVADRCSYHNYFVSEITSPMRILPLVRISARRPPRCRNALITCLPVSFWRCEQGLHNLRPRRRTSPIWRRRATTT